MGIILLLIVSLPLTYAKEACPPESFPVDHISPVTGIRRITCGYLQQGSMIKHGPESEYADNGDVRKIIHFEHGSQVTGPSAPSSLQPNTLEDDDEASFQVLQSLLRILTFPQTGINEGKFKVGKCDSKPSSWIKAAITKASVKKTYVFNESCDVNGSFAANFKEEFPVKFELRNLQNFSSTTMKVRMILKKISGAIGYRFEVMDGIITSEERNLHFKAEYDVEIDLKTGQLKPSTQTGTITITKSGSRITNITRPLVLKQ